MMRALDVSCLNCGRSYPVDGMPYRCPKCGGVYDLPAPLAFDPAKIDRSQPGIWRYRHTFGLPEGAQAVTLGEGNTPLLWAEVLGRQVAFKCEYQNPTSSFKDRGTTVIVSMLKSRGITEIIEDSSGNAGASLAAYGARAGIRVRIFTPAAASGPKRRQIENFGAVLVPIVGSRSDVGDAVRREADKGVVYASHAYLPFNLPGYATAAYEIYEQLGTVPSAVITPVGQGGLMLGIQRGFEAIRQSGNFIPLPKMIGVQARACAPLWAMTEYGASAMGFVTEGQTLAEGVRVRVPIRGDALLKAVHSTQGAFVAVDEENIMPGRDELAKRGLYVEPTTAIVWKALEEMLPKLPDPVVVMLTGSGYKYAG